MVGVVKDAKVVVDHKNKDASSSKVKIINTTEKPTTNDQTSDMYLMEESRKQGRAFVETGPCHTGTCRADSSPTKLEARVVLVTGSGNFWGYLSFNGEEIFFRSTLEQDEKKEDSAAVNLTKDQKMRRRRWRVSRH